MPPGTKTRAIRFTHTPLISDAQYGGRLGGALIMAERVINVAPLALPATSANHAAAAKINNDIVEGWLAWDNGKTGAEKTISAENSEWLMLVWPRAVSLSGLGGIVGWLQHVEAQIYAGPADKHPRDASEAEWKTLKSFSDIKNGYPTALWPNAMPFGETVFTRAVRLRVTAPTTEGGHLNGKTSEGKRIWLGELMALQPIGEAPPQPVIFLVATVGPQPPIAVRFNLEKPGFVTLVIEDESGKRVRNLISETPFPTGKNVAWWDGTDDLGRDVDAAKHGVYKIPAQFVTPGKYTVCGLVHGEIEPHYDFPIYSDGNPAWETADKTCGWLTNHTPPQAALFVPAEKSPTGAAMVYLGSAVSEGGAGLAWVDLNGKKIGGRGWVGGQVPARGWSCPTHALFCIEQTEAHEHPADGANGGHLGRRQAQAGAGPEPPRWPLHR